jgi:hypothetical protein
VDNLQVYHARRSASTKENVSTNAHDVSVRLFETLPYNETDGRCDAVSVTSSSH